MSNLAKKLQQEQHRTMHESKKEIAVKKSWFSPGEKILGAIFAACLFIGAVQIITNQAKIYSINTNIVDTKNLIQKQEKINNDLEVQISELSRYERILEKAKLLGLKLNENNVKVVQE